MKSKTSRPRAPSVWFANLWSLGKSKPPTTTAAAAPTGKAKKAMQPTTRAVGSVAPSIKERLKAAWQQKAKPIAKTTKQVTVPARPAVVARPAEEDALDEMSGDSAAAQARRRERARCERIVTSAAGLVHPVLAQKLAFETRAPVDEALSLLASAPAPFDRTAASAARAARNPQIGTDGPLGRSRQHDLVDRWSRTIDAVRHPGGPATKTSAERG